MRRILYLDTLRGFLILYVVFIHAVLLIIFQANYAYIDILPTWLIAIIFPLLLIAMWGPMFSMMSATTNTYLIYHQLEKGKKLQTIIFNRSISYVLIIVVHLINMVFFIHFIPLDGDIYRSLLCGTLETGQLTIPNILMFVNSGTLLLIGLSGLLINTIFYFLWRKNHHRNIKMTASLFIGLMFVFFIIRPIIFPPIESLIKTFVQQNNIISAIFLSWLFRGQFGLIPMAGIPFFGVIFGLLLAKKTSKKQIKKIGLLSTAGMVIATILFFIWQGIPNLTLPYWPIQIVALNLTLMIMVTTMMILRYEFSSKIKRRILARRTIVLRRFSMITLTMFVFESIITVLWARLFTMIYNNPFPFNIGADLLFLFCVIVTWYFIARLWEKFDFKYSIEWFLIEINKKFTGKSSQKLDVQSVLYNQFDTEK